MNDEMAVSGTENNVPDTFERKDLIEGVIQKHKKFLGEYTSELSELGNKMRELRENIDSSKKNKEEVLGKIEILTEKRQLFYHQVEKILDELDASMSGTPDLSRDLSHLKENAARLKGSMTVEEEQKQVDAVVQELSSLDLNSHSNKEQIVVAEARLKEALSSKIELSSIDNSEETYNTAISSYEKEIEEVSPRHQWLDNRVKSHQEALKYWEDQPLVDNAEEVKA